MPVTEADDLIYQHSDVFSLDDQCQKTLCNRHNLHFSNKPHTACGNEAMAEQLKRIVSQRSRQQVMVIVLQAQRDGNCLFRALSLLFSGQEENHALIRHLVTQHMLTENIRPFIEAMTSNFDGHVENMCHDGTWGTDCEIGVAANLFDCNIMCLCKYGNEIKYALQLFTPHYIFHTPCDQYCHHHVIYLIYAYNHYDAATVLKGKINTSLLC